MQRTPIMHDTVSSTPPSVLSPQFSARIQAVSRECGTDSLELSRQVHSLYTTQMRSCLTLIHSERRLSTGNQRLDRLMDGGLLTGTLNEVFGPSATGKSQLALQLCLSVQLPESEGGLNGDALFIACGKKFPFQRLYTMASHLSATHTYYGQETFGDRIHTIHVTDLEAETHIVQYFIPHLLERKQIRLIVLDSPSFNLRLDEFDTEDDFEFKPMSHSQKGMRHRISTYWSNLKTLQKLAKKHQLVVFIVSQVSSVTPALTAYVSNSSQSAKSSVAPTREFYYYNPDDGGCVQPVMGNISSSIVNSRIFLEMGHNRARKIHVVSSNIQRRRSSSYEITNGGISLTE